MYNRYEEIIETFGITGDWEVDDFTHYRFGWWGNFRLVKYGINEDKFGTWDKVELNEK